MLIRPLLLAIIFATPLLYTRWRKGKWHASISEIYYEEDLRIIWKFTLIAVAYTLSTYDNILLDWAAVSILGVGIFPEINKPNIKKIHDTFAISFFFMIGWYCHPILVLIMGVLFGLGYRFVTIYWLEWIGMAIILTGLTLKEYAVI